MFNENSRLVQVWKRLVEAGTYTIEQVPNISNLRGMVWLVINSNEEE